MLGEYQPQSIVGYFLTCHQVTGDFPVVADCLNAYNLYYTRPRRAQKEGAMPSAAEK